LHLDKKGFMRLIISFLFCSCSVSAQTVFDSSVVKLVDLPVTEPFDTSRAWYRVTNPYVYISSDNDLYNYFGYETAMKYREFNFADYHILGERNDKEWTWVMRENKKAFTEIPVIVSPGHTGPGLPVGRRSFFGDTVIKAVTDTARTRWYTNGQGDCHATFKYRIYADKYHPVLLLKEWNYWGGCRAAGSWDYTLSFFMPAGIIYTIKNTLLMDDYGKLR
jgi:hypothetical protein